MSDFNTIRQTRFIAEPFHFVLLDEKSTDLWVVPGHSKFKLRLKTTTELRKLFPKHEIVEVIVKRIVTKECQHERR